MSTDLPWYSNYRGSDGSSGAFTSDTWSGVLSDTSADLTIGDRNAARTATIANVSANDLTSSRGLSGRSLGFVRLTPASSPAVAPPIRPTPLVAIYRSPA